MNSLGNLAWLQSGSVVWFEIKFGLLAVILVFISRLNADGRDLLGDIVPSEVLIIWKNRVHKLWCPLWI